MTADRDALIKVVPKPPGLNDPLIHEHEYREVWGQHDLRCSCVANRPMKCVGVVLDSGAHLSCRSLAEPNEVRCRRCEEWE